MSAPKKIYYDNYFGTVNREWMVGDTTYIRADIVDELVEALKSLVRNGQKQGWNDKYEWDMDKARAALAKLEDSHD